MNTIIYILLYIYIIMVKHNVNKVENRRSPKDVTIVGVILAYIMVYILLSLAFGTFAAGVMMLGIVLVDIVLLFRYVK